MRRRMSAPRYWLSASVLTIDVGAELERRVEAGLEACGEALVLRQPHDVVDAVLAGHLDGAVGRAVVDHQPLDRVEARQPGAGGRRA